MNDVEGMAYEEQHDAESANQGRTRSWRRWIALLFVLVLLGFVMAEIIDPFGEAEYLPISHGDHYHYVPQDRNPDVPISQFPTVEPSSNERITPDGRIVAND